MEDPPKILASFGASENLTTNCFLLDVLRGCISIFGFEILLNIQQEKTGFFIRFENFLQLFRLRIFFKRGESFFQLKENCQDIIMK